ncbi:hypothetical protein CS378_05470 [Rhodococcus ruber]|uniref:DUF1254 domain-containing protein n=1 Tax=Rhodococcus TaxID=1827 RepID=UPI000299F90E|nr:MULTISPECIES: DUF1254 domain-containing protein [Rhodococcus]ATQ28230.1 hypothetical protein CS378_05470 [Rhodococcus ruber]MBD8054488.1 DUF1254 domain-containing protein [Rhodococcus ruber]MBP2212127.1 hypothetical protein [Rhodococcus ruber]
MTSHSNSTPIPPGIEVPDEVRTRLGTLRFFDGVPDDETTRTVFDNLDFQRAVQAYLLALAPVEVAAVRKAMLALGPANSTMAIWEDLVYPRSVVLTGNNNTSYSTMLMDLHDGPLVLESPPSVLGMINDAWQRWVVDVGLTGPDRGQGGKYLFLPPGYDRKVPGGYLVVRPRTYVLWLLWRSFLDEHGDPHPGVEAIKATARVYPLAEADDPPPLRFVNISPEPIVFVAPAEYRAWELLDETVQSEPAESSDPLTLGMFASIGIRHGKPFDPDERMRAVLTEAATVADATARTLCYRFRRPEAYYYPDSTWRTVLLGGYRFQEDGAALLDSVAQYYFVGAPISPALEVEMVGAASQYAFAFVDSEGAHFDGGRTYRLHVPANVPVANFWSVIAYDTQTRSMLQTGQDWPSISSQDKDLAPNDDGSVDIRFGPDRPEDSRNWIQTLPGKSWFVAFRLYGPLEPWFDKTWRLPDIEPLA